MVKWIVVMKIQPCICLDGWGKPRKNSSQVGRHRDSNPGPPECESHALPPRSVYNIIITTGFIIIIIYILVQLNNDLNINIPFRRPKKTQNNFNEINLNFYVDIVKTKLYKAVWATVSVKKSWYHYCVNNRYRIWAP